MTALRSRWLVGSSNISSVGSMKSALEGWAAKYRVRERKILAQRTPRKALGKYSLRPLTFLPNLFMTCRTHHKNTPGMERNGEKT